MRYSGAGFRKFAKTGLLGLSTLFDLSTRSRCISSIDLPEVTAEQLEMTCENSLSPEFVSAIMADPREFSMALDLVNDLAIAGGSDEFILVFPLPYKDDVTGAVDALDQLVENTIVWRYVANIVTVAPGTLTAGSDGKERVTSDVTLQLSGVLSIFETFNPNATDAAGDPEPKSFSGHVPADATDPGTAAAGYNLRRMLVLEDGSYDFGAGSVALTAGQWIVYDFGGADTWGTEALFD